MLILCVYHVIHHCAMSTNMAYICVGVACPSVEGTWFCELFKNGGGEGGGGGGGGGRFTPPPSLRWWGLRTA